MDDEDPRISGKGNLPAVWRADAAWRDGHEPGAGARRGGAAGDENRRREGANPRGRPRQGGGREAGEIAGGSGPPGEVDPGHEARDTPDGVRRGHPPTAAD